jgi:hypothetical protein
MNPDAVHVFLSIFRIWSGRIFSALDKRHWKIHGPWSDVTIVVKHHDEA